MKKQKKKLQKLVEYILRDFIIYSFVSAVLVVISSLTRSHFTPVTVNSNYMENIAAGGTGTAVTTIGSTFANIAYVTGIIAAILITGIFITKTIMRIKDFIKNKDNSDEKNT